MPSSRCSCGIHITHRLSSGELLSRPYVRNSAYLVRAELQEPGARISASEVGFLGVCREKLHRILRASVVHLFLSNFNTESRRSRSLHGEIRLIRQTPGARFIS